MHMDSSFSCFYVLCYIRAKFNRILQGYVIDTITGANGVTLHSMDKWIPWTQKEPWFHYRKKQAQHNGAHAPMHCVCTVYVAVKLGFVMLIFFTISDLLHRSANVICIRCKWMYSHSSLLDISISKVLLPAPWRSGEGMKYLKCAIKVIQLWFPRGYVHNILNLIVGLFLTKRIRKGRNFFNSRAIIYFVLVSHYFHFGICSRE